MELDSHFGRVSDPYEHLGDWAKQLTGNDADEPAKLSWEDDEDGRKLSACDGSVVDVTPDSGDSIERIIDIYLDIQRQRVQENANNPYELLDKWAKRFDHDQEESVMGQPERQEGKQNPCAPDSTKKRARPDADDPIDNHSDNSEANINEHTKTNGENAKVQEKDKKTRCRHKSVMSGLLRTFFNSPPICECEQDTASVVQSRSARAEPTGRSFRQTSGIVSNNGHSKNEANANSPPPTAINGDYVHVVRHSGMFALRMHSWSPRGKRSVVEDPIPYEPAISTALSPEVTEGEEDSDWDKLSDLVDGPFSGVAARQMKREDNPGKILS